jgi:hypothetical protein
LSGSELGAWSRLGAGTSLELGAIGAGPMQDPGKHFFKITMFIFFTQVSVLLQRKLRSLEQLTAMQAPSSGASELLQSLLARVFVACKEEGLLLLFFAIEKKKAFFFFFLQ